MAHMTPTNLVPSGPMGRSMPELQANFARLPRDIGCYWRKVCWCSQRQVTEARFSSFSNPLGNLQPVQARNVLTNLVACNCSASSRLAWKRILSHLCLLLCLRSCDCRPVHVPHLLTLRGVQLRLRLVCQDVGSWFPRLSMLVLAKQ